jgi:hypothetical protein
MSGEDTNQVRVIAKGIAQRAIADPAFADRLRADPRATVLEAGLPEQVVDDFITHDLGLEAEVSGYHPLACSQTCIIWTCAETIKF